ncbi:unnamed protein product [Caenorhabditis angaria]|uniref:non-specific serine/threonine protein kinase n=1 Tax=Caenorhabditis angaria TaxID=860376 RepID=A0A9P1N4Q2_9PELO|nr:unnamed protein product [Caenorhabditis angaria]
MEPEFTMISHMEPSVLQEIYNVCDMDDVWLNIAPYMPGIEVKDVETCKRWRMTRNRSPTQLLFRIWSAKGYTSDHLYQLFAKTKLVRCMRIIQPFVHERLHYLEELVLNPQKAIDLPKEPETPKPKKRKLRKVRLRHKPIITKPADSCEPGPSRPRIVEKREKPPKIAENPSRNSSLTSKVIHPKPTESSLLAYRNQRPQTQSILVPKMPPISQQQSINLSELTATTASNLSNDEFPIRIAIEGTLPVSYTDIEIATNMFSTENIIGKGGYGIVYRGELRSGGTVAVKRITTLSNTNNTGTKSSQVKKMEKERMRQSLQELKTLARFRHDNILPIYAYCLEGPEPCLVYQYMANGSLEDRLLCRKMSNPLTWTQKLEISLGTAKGLHYLHTFTKTPIIHGDVKTANILLDKHLEPKLGDFGLSRDGQMEAEIAEKSPLIASHIKGTLAYLPPEFVTSKILSTKLDVYSFGIVLAEIATGLRAYSDTRDPRGLIDFCQMRRDIVENLNILRELIVDKKTPAPINDIEKDAFAIIIDLGLKSAQRDRLQRPNMDKIVEILQAATCSTPKIETLSIKSEIRPAENV